MSSTVQRTSPRREGEPWPDAIDRIHAERRQLSESRRARVLAHPDLAIKLTAAPLDYTEPGRWSGYVPPRMWAEQLNNSPRRAALVDICAEAAKRTTQKTGTTDE